MGWKPRGILSPKLRHFSNPLTPGLVSRNLLKLQSKNYFYLLQSISSISFFFICFQHKNSTLTRSGQESPFQPRTNQNLIYTIPHFSAREYYSNCSPLCTINPETCTSYSSYISSTGECLCTFASCARKESYHGKKNFIKSCQSISEVYLLQ